MKPGQIYLCRWAGFRSPQMTTGLVRVEQVNVSNFGFSSVWGEILRWDAAGYPGGGRICLTPSENLKRFEGDPTLIGEKISEFLE